jgi:D-arabinose 5-phosphate isomerase GutQ
LRHLKNESGPVIAMTSDPDEELARLRGENARLTRLLDVQETPKKSST